VGKSCGRVGRFDVSGFTCFRDIEGSKNFKSRSRDPFSGPFDLILHCLLVPLVINAAVTVNILLLHVNWLILSDEYNDSVLE